MYTWMYICMYTCILVFRNACIHVCCIHVHRFYVERQASMFMYLCMYMQLDMSDCTHACFHVNMYVHM